MYSFVSGLFCSHTTCKTYPSCVLLWVFVLLIYLIPSRDYIKIDLSVLLFMGINVVFSLGLVQIVLL